VYHTSMKSDGNNIIQVTLTKNGSLAKASFLPEDEVIVFPVTNDSIARSGKNPPSHPLVDKISYISSENKDLHQLYLKAFNDWYQTVEEPEVKTFLTIIKDFLHKEDFLTEILNDLYGIDNYTLAHLKVSHAEKDKQKTIDLAKIFLTFAVSDFHGYQTAGVTDFIELHNNY